MENTSHEKGVFGEDFVSQLAYTSFMKYWCYPNPIDIMGNQKEICDLLVYFNDILILICVKNYAFNGNYERYFRKTIGKDVKQLCGAKRKIDNAVNGLYIKHPNRQGNTHINISDINTIHLITVHFGGDAVELSPVFDENKENFIHVFNNLDFELMMKELDTLPDFVEYLDKRKDFFKTTSDKQLYIGGTEGDLIAKYLINQRTLSISYENTDTHIMCDISDYWNKFCSQDEVNRRNEENRTSYFIDNLVKDQIEIGGQNLELAKFLLGFNRFDRRCIAQSFFDFYKIHCKTQSNKLYFGRRYWKLNDDIAFAYAYVSPLDCNVDEVVQLIGQSYIIKNKYETKLLLVISTVKNMEQFKFALFSPISKMSPSEEEYVMEGARIAGWFQQEELIPVNFKEYPD